MGISTITSAINSMFSAIDSMITCVVPMPAILLLCACLSRQGLSTLRSLSNICAQLESLGIPMGSNPDGSTNLIVCFTHAIVKEMNRALTEDAVCQGAVEPASDILLSQGANAAGPVVSMGTTLMPGKVYTVIH